MSKEYLRTGDLGFLDENNQLFVTGRLKDLIIFQGRNIYPQDIEATVFRSNEDLINQACAAFSVNVSNGEQLVVVQEVKRNVKEYELIFESIIQQLLEEHDIVPFKIILIRQATLPKTSSGKIQRSLCRQLLQKNELIVVEKWEQESVELDLDKEFVFPRDEIERKLGVIWSELLKIENVGIYSNFFAMGGHSIKATQVVAMVRQEFGFDLSLRSIFENPTIEGVANIIKEKFRDPLITQNNMQQLPKITCDLENRYKKFPLTNIQEAYWIGRSGSFEFGNVSTYAYFEFDYICLDIKKLEKAWNMLIKRHEALRLVFTNTGEQQILKEVPHYTIDVNNLVARTEEEINGELDSIRSQLSHQVLPADNWPLFEIRATKFNGKIRLHIGLDALIVDAWSMMLLFDELCKLYSSLDYELPLLNLSFRDYVIALGSIKESDYYNKDKQYWMGRILNFPSAPALPTKQLSMKRSKQTFARCSVVINSADWQSLQKEIRGCGLTASGFLAAIYADVLAKWSQSSHFAINLTLFNRLPLDQQVNEIAGDFTSLSLLEVDYRGNNNFIDKARKLQHQLWCDLDHSLYDAVEFQRELARNNEQLGMGNIMPVVFTCVLGNEGRGSYLLDDNGKLVYGITQTPQVWLDYKAYEINGDLVIEWDYVEDLFHEGMIEEMHKAYLYLFNKLRTDFKVWNQEIDLLPKEQSLTRLLVNSTEWNVEHCLLQELFHKQVNKSPEQLAIISDSKNISYKNLQKLSNQLGYKLRELGAEPNKLIAIVIKKGWEQVVAALSILNSGAAYLPINPDLPEDRLNQLLVQGEVSIILTQSDHTKRLRPLSYVTEGSVEILEVDKIIEELSTYPGECLVPAQKLTDLAYVIFTSGSTGVPKGVMIDHRAAANTILDINDQYNVAAEDKVLALSDLGFDLSVYDIFGLLAAGGTIILPKSYDIKDPYVWLDLIDKHQTTIWNTVPMFMQMLVESIGEDQLLATELTSSLRLVLLSGDYIPLSLPDNLRNLYKTENTNNIKIISLGGATEAAIWSISYPINEVNVVWTTIPYGRPLRNQRIHVLNDRMECCPDHVVGEIYIGGIGLARGYWRDEDKTRASFVINPHTQESLYKTGDLGRYLPDGTIEFLGRNDYQVKVGGHRIELGEIENALSSYEGIKQSVVLVKEHLDNNNLSSNQYLVGYYLSDKKLDEEGVLRHLGSRLPEYMVPSVLVHLEKLPLTVNGKLDRRALPDTEFAGDKDNYVAPRNELEQKVCGIWAEVLNISEDKVGIHDDFFRLGGNSILAIKLVSKLNKELDGEIVISLVFNYNTVDKLAHYLEQFEIDEEGKEYEF